ncbi:MAG: tRNA (N(6)-L-threonylcarbamoyladenosine(37)-C(2))-methylthiotransferase MtaB [Planctomycetota bacterium]|jgi:threonylcarbamoyladenosine tRNA methylthiotransferase MtaB|nr:tRNA (N(6)-L-threonylcarbamoyladenosine(37)-C(2))-methylthiotransferase MtaB [Planctomycetota bacterium]
MIGSKTVAFHTLGCKVNQYDTGTLRQGLLQLGYREIPFGVGADLYVINTCTVTQMAGQKSRKAIQGVHRENPDSILLVTGCYADSDYDVLKRMDGVDRVFTNREKDLIPAHVAGLEKTDPEIRRLSGQAHETCHQQVEMVRVADFGRRTRAFVKVQDGCNLMCTYCIIPHVRGELASREIDDVLEECRQLVAHGYREIVLAGIHLGAYGKDRTGSGTLVELVSRMLAIEGLERIRLSSIELQSVTRELVELFASNPERLCPHLHIPLQSGNSRILRRMARRYDRETFLKSVAWIREVLPNVAFNTDIIVGFPGETEEAFEDTLSACKEVGFSKIHVFPYSDRPGTPSINFSSKVPSSVIRDRKSKLLSLEAELNERFRKDLIGRTVRVLPETRREGESGELTGLSDEYVRVQFAGGEQWVNRFVRVKVEQLLGAGVRGRLLTDQEVTWEKAKESVPVG